MPILAAEPTLFPENLLSSGDGLTWWALYTLSKQEKKLCRTLLAAQVPFYCPTVEKRYRSPNGRLRTTHIPLFSNYVFLAGDEQSRYVALDSGCVSRCIPVESPKELTEDLALINGLVQTGAPLTPEARIEPGDKVRVKTGSFAGYEGTVMRRDNELRLVVNVRFMEQGVSVALDDCQIEVI